MAHCASQRTLMDFCRSAYECQKSTYMYTLARLSLKARNDKRLNAYEGPFDDVRRHLKQLGRRFQAAKALLTYGARLSELTGRLEIHPIDTPSAQRLPPVDMLTKLDSIAVRMFSKDSPDLSRYQQALGEMDETNNLFDHFLHNYRSGDARPYVHAEIQVLDWFHTRRLLFVGDDPFIACSRPVCLSCLSYFKSHPGRFVEPYSDHETCLSWRPPVLDTDVNRESLNEQRDTLISMTRSIRKEACHQIIKKSSSSTSRSDFPNRASSFEESEQCSAESTGMSDLLSRFRALVVSHCQTNKEGKKLQSSGELSPTALSPSSWEANSRNSWVSNFSRQSFLNGPENNSDQEGGVSL